MAPIKAWTGVKRPHAEVQPGEAEEPAAKALPKPRGSILSVAAAETAQTWRPSKMKLPAMKGTVAALDPARQRPEAWPKKPSLSRPERPEPMAGPPATQKAASAAPSAEALLRPKGPASTVKAKWPPAPMPVAMAASGQEQAAGRASGSAPAGDQRPGAKAGSHFKEPSWRRRNIQKCGNTMLTQWKLLEEDEKKESLEDIGSMLVQALPDRQLQVLSLYLAAARNARAREQAWAAATGGAGTEAEEAWTEEAHGEEYADEQWTRAGHKPSWKQHAASGKAWAGSQS